MEPSAFFAQPMAAPTAKSSGRLSNSAPPPAAKIDEKIDETEDSGG